MNLHWLNRIALISSVIGVIAFILDFGFTKSTILQQLIDAYYFMVIAIGLASTFLRYKASWRDIKRGVFIFDTLTVFYTAYIFYMYLFVGEAFKTDLILENPIWVILAVILTFIRELSVVKFNYNRTLLNPAQLFIISFFAIILLGSLLLMLPKATHAGINFTDALFTSTSAVCVTGLIVVDTGSYFTIFGQSIILILIQIGGLGILTFASYFSYFFKGGTTYESQLSLSEITNVSKLSDVFKTLKIILLITFIIEAISAVLIYFSLDTTVLSSFSQRIFFSIFHAVSAFCNAGFSTLSNSVYETGYRFNYGLQLIIIATFVFGGLGFSIVSNMMAFAKYKILTLFKFNQHQNNHQPWILNLNTRITLVTTLSLTAIGFVLFFILEYNNTLADHSFFGKLVTSLFGAATPRTAGFNSVNMAELAFPTIMITFLLMWIGASPASTGGGIKTSTFAIATLNIFSLARGKSRIEVFRREIADVSVRRAFATISLSLIIIGFGIVSISFLNPELGLLNIAFECFSAYSTVGLSLGITASLSTASKFVIIIIMFVGRVSMLSILLAIIVKVKHKNYRYPTEEITIN